MTASEQIHQPDQPDQADEAEPSQTGPGGRGRLTAVVAGVVSVLAVAAVVGWLTLGQSDDDPAPASQDDPAATQPADSTDEPSPAPPSSAAPSETAPPATPLPPAVDFARAAGKAVDAGVPALVPDAYADSVGVVTGASFDDGVWQLTVTTQQGDVVVRQHAGPAGDLVGRYADRATPRGSVNLAAWGLGTWDRSEGPDGAAISRDLPDGGALITGPSADIVTAVAKTLLTFENTGGGEQD